jgi:two-component system NarL family sensor kinase
VALATAHAERSGFVVDVDVHPSSVGAYDKLVFSLIRELVTNAAKHSRAGRVAVRVAGANDCVRVEVRDDGVGFDPDDLSASVAGGHIGLAAAAERTEGARGSMTIVSAPGEGTDIRVELPLPAATPTGPKSGVWPASPDPADRQLTGVGED